MRGRLKICILGIQGIKYDEYRTTRSCDIVGVTLYMSNASETSHFKNDGQRVNFRAKDYFSKGLV